MVIGHEAWHGFSHCGSLVHERDPLWADLQEEFHLKEHRRSDFYQLAVLCRVLSSRPEAQSSVR